MSDPEKTPPHAPDAAPDGAPGLAPPASTPPDSTQRAFTPPTFASPGALNPEPSEAGRAASPLLGVLGFLLLLAGLIWVWRQDVGLRRDLGAMRAQLAASTRVDPARVAALETTLDTVRQQVAALQATPQPHPVDLAPIQQRLTALEQRPTPPPPPDLKPLVARIAALERRPLPPPAPDLKPLETRIAALEQRPLPPDLGPLTARVTALENKPAVKPEDPAMNARVASLAAAQQATQHQAEIAAAAARASGEHAARLQTLQQAQQSLLAGRPLGPLPDAPPALARFATAPPPTEAALRLSFPQAARAAAAASQPSIEGLSLPERMWQRARALVTIRQGDRVIVGAPASTTLAAARLRLEAGDLPGAVAALDKLDPKAAQAMAPWQAQAQSLLDARAALASMAAG